MKSVNTTKSIDVLAFLSSFWIPGLGHVIKSNFLWGWAIFITFFVITIALDEVFNIADAWDYIIYIPFQVFIGFIIAVHAYKLKIKTTKSIFFYALPIALIVIIYQGLMFSFETYHYPYRYHLIDAAEDSIYPLEPYEKNDELILFKREKLVEETTDLWVYKSSYGDYVIQKPDSEANDLVPLGRIISVIMSDDSERADIKLD